MEAVWTFVPGAPRPEGSRESFSVDGLECHAANPFLAGQTDHQEGVCGVCSLERGVTDETNHHPIRSQSPYLYRRKCFETVSDSIDRIAEARWAVRYKVLLVHTREIGCDFLCALP